METRQHPKFIQFISGIKDATTKAKILINVLRLAAGNLGKAKPVGKEVSELKINCEAGGANYYKKVGNEIVLLVAGGAKNGQQRDIEAAKKLVAEMKR